MEETILSCYRLLDETVQSSSQKGKLFSVSENKEKIFEKESSPFSVFKNKIEKTFFEDENKQIKIYINKIQKKLHLERKFSHSKKELHKICRSALTKLRKYVPYSNSFFVTDDNSDKKRMTMRAIQKKLKRNVYTSTAEFRTDLKTVYDDFKLSKKMEQSKHKSNLFRMKKKTEQVLRNISEIIIEKDFLKEKKVKVNTEKDETSLDYRNGNSMANYLKEKKNCYFLEEKYKRNILPDTIGETFFGSSFYNLLEKKKKRKSFLEKNIVLKQKIKNLLNEKEEKTNLFQFPKVFSFQTAKTINEGIKKYCSVILLSCGVFICSNKTLSVFNDYIENVLFEICKCIKESFDLHFLYIKIGSILNIKETEEIFLFKKKILKENKTLKKIKKKLKRN